MVQRYRHENKKYKSSRKQGVFFKSKSGEKLQISEALIGSAGKYDGTKCKNYVKKNKVEQTGKNICHTHQMLICLIQKSTLANQLEKPHTLENQIKDIIQMALKN